MPPLWEVKVQAPVGLLAALPRGHQLLGASSVGGEGAGPSLLVQSWIYSVNIYEWTDTVPTLLELNFQLSFLS